MKVIMNNSTNTGSHNISRSKQHTARQTSIYPSMKIRSLTLQQIINKKIKTKSITKNTKQNPHSKHIRQLIKHIPCKDIRNLRKTNITKITNILLYDSL